MLVSAALVFLMTPGLALFYAGLVVVRRNVLEITTTVFISIGVVTIIWFLFGFSLAFGPDVGGVIGDLSYVGLNGVGLAPSPTYAPTIPFLGYFAYELMFAIITPALIIGAFADRIDLRSYLLLLVGFSILIYIPFAHWIWGGGFLHQLGVIDFAGGIVVHTSAGTAALASAFTVIQRQPWRGQNPPPTDIIILSLGAGLLWFGWFGFNGGSAFQANGVAFTALTNTQIAASLALVSWLLLPLAQGRQPSTADPLTGAVAGLATITPAAGYVAPWGAAIIGLAGGVICYLAVQLRKKMRWDDALDVWGVHGVGGASGAILVGVFAVAAVNNVSGLIEGNLRQFAVQVAAVVLAIVYAFVVSWIMLTVIKRVVPGTEI